MTKQRKSKIQPKRSFRAFSVLRHPNHFLLAGVGRLALVSLRNRTAKRRGRQNAWVWQTWRGYYLRVLSGIHLTLIFFALLQKDLSKGMSSLAEGFFKQNYCHARRTRCAVLFPPPSCCLNSLLFRAKTSSLLNDSVLPLFKQIEIFFWYTNFIF